MASSGLVGLASLLGNLPGSAAVPRAPDLPGAAAVQRSSDLPGSAAVPRSSDLSGLAAVQRASDLPGPAAVQRASDLPAVYRSPVSQDRPQVPQGAGFLQGNGPLASVAAAVRGGGGSSQISRQYQRPCPEIGFAAGFGHASTASVTGGQAQPATTAGNQQGASSTPPRQWLGQAPAAPPDDPFALLVGGINQLQAAMLKQYDGGDTAPEAGQAGNLGIASIAGL